MKRGDTVFRCCLFFIFPKNLTEKFLLLQIVAIFGVLYGEESVSFVKLNSSLRHNDSTIFY